MKCSRIISAAVAALFLASCAPGSGGPSKQELGALIGIAGGAAIGSTIGKRGSGGKAAAIIGLAALGAFLGSEIGRSLDRADRVYMAQMTQASLEESKSGLESSWANPDSGNYGTITPQPAFQEKGKYCREFQQTVTIGGKTETAYGTACRQPDGAWKIIAS